MVALPTKPQSVAVAAPASQSYLLLAIIILAWGGNYPLMRLAINDMPPLAFTAIRLVGASCVLAVILVASFGRKALIPIPGERVPLAIIGFFQVAVVLGLTIIGLTTVSPGRTVVLVYTMQLWAVPLGVWLLRERVGVGKLAGTAVGFAGIMVFFNPTEIDWLDAGMLLGSGLILLASLAWALGSCLYRKQVWKTGFMTQTLWQFLVSLMPISALSLLLEHDAAVHPSLQLAIIVLFNWFVPTALAMWCWAKVLFVMPASTAGQFLLLTPIVGFLLSAVFLDEPVSSTLVASAALIAIGIFLTMRSDAAELRKRGVTYFHDYIGARASESASGQLKKDISHE